MGLKLCVPIALICLLPSCMAKAAESVDRRITDSSGTTVVIKEACILMKDGVQLAADLYSPDEGQRRIDP